MYVSKSGSAGVFFVDVSHSLRNREREIERRDDTFLLLFFLRARVYLCGRANVLYFSYFIRDFFFILALFFSLFSFARSW